jgi:hypothetical protein
MPLDSIPFPLMTFILFFTYFGSAIQDYMCYFAHSRQCFRSQDPPKDRMENAAG